MRGLLVKDMRMMLGQKKFFLMVLFMAIVLNFSSNANATFVVYYLTFVCSFFAMNSVAYDESDNGYPFLFTLPVNRSIYVREKYLFGVILNLSSWLAGMCVCLAFQVARHTLSAFTDSIPALVLMIPVMLIFISVTFPLVFKFGSEKGRIVMLCALGVLFFAGYTLNMLVDLENVIRIVYGYPTSVLAVSLFGVMALILAGSYGISVMIMKKKEL